MFSWANKQLEKLSETLAPPPSTPGHRFLAALASGDEPAALAALNDTSESFDPNNAFGPFDPNAPLNHRGMNALHAAASHGSAQVMRAVLARGVHVESRDNDGWTALHHAAGTNSVPPQSALATVKLLVGEMGADLCAKNKGGQTPYDVGSSQAVRGYLLPLQLQRETQQCLDNGGAGLAPGIDLGRHVKNVAPPPTVMPGQMPKPGAPPQMGNDPIAGLMQPPNAALGNDPYAALMQPPPVRGVGSAYSSHSSLAGSAPPSGGVIPDGPAPPMQTNTFGSPSPVGNATPTFSSPPPVAASPALTQPPVVGDASATFSSPPVATSTPAHAPAGKPSASSSFLPPPPKMTSLSPPPVMTSLVNDMKDASLNDGAEQPAAGDATAEATGEEEDEGMKEVNLDESAEEPQPIATPGPALTQPPAQVQPPQQHAPTLENAGTGFGQPPVQIQPPQPQPQMQQTPEQPPKSNNSVSSHPGQPPKSANSAASSSSGYALRGGNSNAAFVLDQSKFSGRRIYKPDGFHTSSNDKELQAKYGHVDNEFETSRKLAVPPPPMSGGARVSGGAPGGANPYSAAGAGGPPSGGGNPYSAMGRGASRGRYPAYCAVSDSVSAPPSFAGQGGYGSQPGAAPVPAYATFNPAVAQTQQQQWSGDQQQQQQQQPQQMQQQYSAHHGSTFS